MKHFAFIFVTASIISASTDTLYFKSGTSRSVAIVDTIGNTVKVSSADGHTFNIRKDRLDSIAFGNLKVISLVNYQPTIIPNQEIDAVSIPDKSSNVLCDSTAIASDSSVITSESALSIKKTISHTQQIQLNKGYAVAGLVSYAVGFGLDWGCSLPILLAGDADLGIAMGMLGGGLQTTGVIMAGAAASSASQNTRKWNVYSDRGRFSWGYGISGLVLGPLALLFGGKRDFSVPALVCVVGQDILYFVHSMRAVSYTNTMVQAVNNASSNTSIHLTPTIIPNGGGAKLTIRF